MDGRQRLPRADAGVRREVPSRGALADWRWIDAACLGALLALGGYVFYVDLGSYPLLKWDEALYASLARRSVESGRWLVPRGYVRLGLTNAEFGPFLEKPPLVVWLQAVSISIFGATEFAVRVHSATFAVLTGAVVYVAGRHRFDRVTGAFAGAIFLATPALSTMNNGGRFGGTDTALVCIGSLFVLLVWRAVEADTRYLVPAGGALGLAVLTKGLGAGIFGLVVLPLLVARPAVLRDENAAYAAGVAALVVLPWPLYVWLQHGNEFLRILVLDQVVGRVTGELAVYPGATFGFMKYPYFEEFLGNPAWYYPWLFLLPGAIAGGVSHDRRTRIDERIPAAAFLTWWAGSILCFFAVTGNHPWYLLPMFVPTALLVGRTLRRAMDRRLDGVVAVATGVAGVVAFDGRYGPAAAIALVAAATALVLSRTGTIGPLDGRGSRALGAGATVAVVVLLLAGVLAGLPATHHFSDMHTEEELSREVERNLPPGATVHVGSDMPVAMHTFAFYTERPISGTDAAELERTGGERYAVVTERTMDRVDRPHRVVASERFHGESVHVVRFRG